MSDIVYIGCTTKGQRTVRDRLKDHLAVRKLERNTAYHLELVQREVNVLEVSWKVVDTHTDATDAERILLERYAADHFEFPPLNRQGSGRQIRIAEELLQSLVPNQKIKIREVLERLAKQQISGKPV